MLFQTYNGCQFNTCSQCNILLPVTDDSYCPSWSSRRERIAIEFFHDQFPRKLCGRAGARTRDPCICSQTRFRASEGTKEVMGLLNTHLLGLLNLFLDNKSSALDNDLQNRDQSSLLQSKKISNNQELTQSDPTPSPQNQKGNNQTHKFLAGRNIMLKAVVFFTDLNCLWNTAAFPKFWKFSN